jgi:ATP synthase protein I
MSNANDKPDTKRTSEPSALSRAIGAKAASKLRAQRRSAPGVWYGLGMMGLIGWSVAIPTLLGAAIGLWLDKQNLSPRSWTLALMVAGLTIGCMNAWVWISKEDQAMRDERKREEQDSVRE